LQYRPIAAYTTLNVPVASIGCELHVQKTLQSVDECKWRQETSWISVRVLIETSNDQRIQDIFACGRKVRSWKDRSHIIQS